jgi:imidazole glycerol-phosphate synthase subunit HisH
MKVPIKALLIDYGSGNIRSAAKALERAGFEVLVSSDPAQVAAADALVIPGQGHFRQVMEHFDASGFREPLLEATQRGVPLLGICVGMQMLFESSSEAPGLAGLGLLGGHLERFATGTNPVPQMQWNTLEPVGDSPMMLDLPCNPFAYFVHSFYVSLDSEIDSGAITDYGLPFWSVVSKGNIHGTQFHPEKSQAIGLKMLENFRRFAEKA